MQKYGIIISLLTLISCSNTEIKDYPVRQVPFTRVSVQDQFWKPRLDTNRLVTIPFSFRMCEKTGRIDNFAIAAGLKEGRFCSRYPFDDSDVYKIIEGASYALLTDPDTKLESYLDDIITLIEDAQEEDGYLMSWRSIDPDNPPTEWSGDHERWSNLQDGHELYNMGHMYEAAVAHYMATGKKQFLDIAMKNAELILKVFGPGGNTGVPGHEEIEIGLVKLYRVTGDKRYLEQARHFIDQRGREIFDHEGETTWETGEYWQKHKPVVEQDEAVGHAVRAAYLYSGMADVYALTGTENYGESLFKIWEDVVRHKLYITGGIGAIPTGEAFGPAYELPNITAYAETCAAIANVFWNYRMFLLTSESKYMDVLERTLYNGALSGISMEGNAFFYPNVLESSGKTRNEWFPCSCCPSNITRFIPSVPGYIYASKDETLFVNLFIGSKASVELNGNEIQISQETHYPWDGEIVLELLPRKPGSFTLKIRLPGWAQGKPVPGDLYSYESVDGNGHGLWINEVKQEFKIVDGYLVLNRRWEKGDQVKIRLNMPVRSVIAHKKVMADSGKVAFERGPLVYCAEWIDNKNNLSDVRVPAHPDWERYESDVLLGGMVFLKEKASGLTLVPYFAWAHRGEGPMKVWLEREW